MKLFRAQPILTSVVTLILVACCGVGVRITDASFASEARNPSNDFATGTVILTDNDGGVATINATGLKPNEGRLACLKVTHAGSLQSNVRLYGSFTGTLTGQLNLSVIKGSVAAAFPSCSAFVADTTVHIAGQPPGLLWTGDVGAFPTDWNSGVIDPLTWGNPTTVAYRFEVSVADSSTVINKSSLGTLVAEARNT